jgi:uncharacterized protein YaiI (UPF0178 family)
LTETVESERNLEILIDADACPVKDDAFKVACRHGVRVFVFANSPIRIPHDPLIERVVVPAGPDAADDRIAERARPGAVVVTADIPLASRCVKAGATVIAPDGRTLDDRSIGPALAMRDLMTDLRSAGMVTSGPKPFTARDRSSFLSALDLALVRAKRAGFAAN